MPRTLILCSLWAAALTLGSPLAPACRGQTVWSGFSVPFSKALFVDPSSPDNQDRITDNVWITRGTNQGLYNARVETGYVAVSPADTEWATALIAANAGEAIAASNWQDLTFDDWVTAYGGMGTSSLPGNLLANNAVVHLITDDIYLDLRFTGWSGSGGSFSYERAAAIPEPTSATVLLIGLIVFSWRSRQQYGQREHAPRFWTGVAQAGLRRFDAIFDHPVQHTVQRSFATPRRLIPCTLGIAALVLELGFAPSAGAQTVWSGFDVQFSKALFADPTLPENQDRITDNVWITRGVNRGLFNARVEIGYVDNVSPEDTEWATAMMAANAGEEIAASNWSDLTYTDWVTAYGGMGSGMLPANLLANNAVVHLITDDVYLDLRFTGWSGAGGSFSYDRAMGTITPPAATGDYNGNGVVDAADYVIWRKTLNQTVPEPGDGADGDRSGVIDQGDYDFWRMQFGDVVPVPVSDSGHIAAVPEPATSGLLMFATLVALGRWPRKRSHYQSLKKE